jgi:prepilin peptidase CpaA
LTLPAQIIWMGALALTFVAGWTDLRTRRIPNWLTVPALLAGIAINSILMGWHGTKLALEGAGLALGLLLPLVLMRGLGAGDWKLMGAAGAILGPARFMVVLLASILFAGVMAVFEIVRQGGVKQTVVNIAVLVQGFFIFGLQPNPRISLDNPRLIKLPFGVAVAVATVTCYLMVRFHVKL